jgi:hypothetical protein
MDIWTCNEFSMFGHALFFLFHYDLQSFKVLHTKQCSPHYVCIMWKKTIETINEPKKRVLFSKCFPHVFIILVKILFDMCFDNLI